MKVKRVLSVCLVMDGLSQKNKGFLLVDALLGFCIASSITMLACTVIAQRIQTDQAVHDKAVQMEESMEAVIRACENELDSAAISSVNMP